MIFWGNIPQCPFALVSWWMNTMDERGKCARAENQQDERGSLRLLSSPHSHATGVLLHPGVLCRVRRAFLLALCSLQPHLPDLLQPLLQRLASKSHVERHLA